MEYESCTACQARCTELLCGAQPSPPSSTNYPGESCQPTTLCPPTQTPLICLSSPRNTHFFTNANPPSSPFPSHSPTLMTPSTSTSKASNSFPASKFPIS